MLTNYANFREAFGRRYVLLENVKDRILKAGRSVPPTSVCPAKIDPSGSLAGAISLCSDSMGPIRPSCQCNKLST